MKLISLLALACLLSVGLNAQNSDSNSENNTIYKRVQVPSLGDATMNQLDALGIDLGCGVIHTNGRIQLELSGTELQRLDANGIRYNVLVEDLIDFYSKRSEQELESAKAELQSMKMQSAMQRTFSVTEVINNVGQHDDCEEIDWAVPNNFNLNPNPSPNSFGGCLTFDMVLQELDDMRSQYPNLISAKANASPSGQTTIEGRTVYYVRISDNPDIDEPNEPETLYQSLIHSRESATVMNQLFFMWYLLENYDSDPAVRALVNNQALYFIPVFNPDGFVHNQNIAPNGGGLQRKNRNIVGSCGTVSTSDDYGVDLNRNSAYYWGNGGASSDPCSQTYLGSAPFSENETQIMRDFFLLHDFELALNHHSFKNAMLHAYAGTTITNPRPDEYSKYNHDMTAYNRYAHGPSTSISALNSGNMNDWMLGGPAGVSANGTPTGTGSGKQTLAWTPENGSSAEAGATGSGFWPAPSNFVPIAKRAMRMNFLAAYFSGKYAKLHDLSQTDINTLSGTLDFAVENLGQKASAFTVTVTPVSSNIASIGSAVTLNGMAVLQQNNVSINYTLNSGIQPNEEIEYKVTLTNDYTTDNVLFEANIKKIYSPNVVLADNPDATGLNNWTANGGSWAVTSDAFSGTSAITTNSGAYGNSISTQLQLTNTIDLSSASQAILQYYAKWDLERSFDYVQIEASTNGSTWTPLCGRLTKPGAPNINNTYSGKSSTNNNFQPDGEPLYDGDTQDRWTMEEIVIDASQNSFLLGQSNVFFRFDFRTDGSNREDSYVNVDFEGFTFDDFKVTTIELPCDASVPPANLSASNITSDMAQISWASVPSATYDLRYRTAGATNWITIPSLTTTNFDLTGLTFSTTYEVEVNANCATSSSVFSSPLFFTTQDNVLSEGYFETGLDGWIEGGNDCARIQSTSSFEGSFSIRIRDNSGVASSMTSPVIDATGFDSLEIDFHFFANSMENGEDFWVQFFDGSSYNTVATFTSGADFSNGNFNKEVITIDSNTYNFASNSRFRIVCDASGNNDQVFIDAVIIKGISSGPDVIPPSPPQNLLATNITVDSVDLNWNASSDNVGVVAYEVYQDNSLIATVTQLNYQATGLSPSTTYNYNVIAKDAAGNSSGSSNVEVILTLDPPDTESPSAPLNLQANNTTETETNLSWTASIDNVGVTAYDVYQNGIFLGTSTNTNYNVSSLSAGQSYSFHVIARDAANNSSDQSNTVNVITPDNTAPIISIIGDENVNLSVGENYTEFGATATDNVDGVITANITTSGVVDTSTVGNYTVSYSVSDSSGNSTTETRTIVVTPDTVAPIITLVGASVVDLNLGSPYNEEGATATDNVDGDLTNTIVISGSVDTNTAGAYVLTYSVTDSSGNVSDVTRTVNVILDETPPILTLLGASTVNLQLNDTYIEQGATATDNIDGDLTANIIISGTVDTSVAGNYSVNYEVSDASGNTAATSRTVTVEPDTTAPIITIKGSSSITLNVGDNYIEEGATAIDNIDGDLTTTIVITGTVDTANAGVYTITYTVSDVAGNNANEVRTINVIADTTPPVITLIGASTINLNIGDNYIEQGATAIDNIDGDITSSIGITGTVDTNISGNYTVTYSVNDMAGNQAVESRLIIVEEPNTGCSNGVGLPYSQGFESSFGSWVQSLNDDLDWLLSSGGTPSSGTGPSAAIEGTNYIYVEASVLDTGYPDKRAILTSPCINLNGVSEATFSFNYHMFGAPDMGSLDVELSSDDGITWSSIWSQTGNQGDNWQAVNIDLSPYTGAGIRLRFNRFVGSTWQADIAIDNLSLVEGVVQTPSCIAEVSSFPYAQGFESGLGDWTQSAADDIDWTVDASGTPSSGTGPLAAIQGNNYIFVEASGNGTGYPNKRAIVNSPCFDLTTQSSATFSFSYHMFGSTDMGSIALQASNDNGISWTTLWIETGNQGDIWLSQTIDLSTYLGNTVQLRFDRVTGGTWQADIAIDNISLNTASAARGYQNEEISIEPNKSIFDVITLYPNPSSGQAIRVKTSLEIEAYSIFNALGQEVGRGPLNGDRIDVENLEAGVYLISFKVENKTLVERFIKR
ncbi:DUF5011 domain-containing protein [Winogradskyella maritima]|uniref:Immunoglobulin-like domain-containing protein n=1 Tax=Winogradskyella maritima TaxID=1517766 RepID=A0ABV8ADF5_9FLAO|nr:DUF5011 domain-containing protein [Winogradskyella maritima]